MIINDYYLPKYLIYRYLALEGLCLMSNSEFSADAVRKHQETVVSALKVNLSRCLHFPVAKSTLTSFAKKYRQSVFKTKTKGCL